jgi:hypothetical protein
LAALATGLGGKGAILGEASLLMGDIGAALTGDLTLLVSIHARKAAVCACFLGALSGH